MRRSLTALYCTASLLAWLAYGPYFHAHEAAEGGEIHAHFDVEEREEHHADDDHAEIESPHHGHHGTEVSVFTGHFSRVVATFVEVHEVYRLIEEPVRQGTVIEQPVRVHDPPARVSSSPRSPPA